MQQPGLVIQDIETSKLVPYENNPRLNDKAVDSVAESIKAYGFKQPLVVDKDYVIVVGHTRLKAAKKLGLDTVPVVVAKDLSPAQIKAYRLADNKVADLSIWDNKKLLLELDDIDEDLFTGFDTSELFDDVFDDDESDILEENELGVQYRVTFVAATEVKAHQIIDAWEKLSDDV